MCVSIRTKIRLGHVLFMATLALLILRLIGEAAKVRTAVLESPLAIRKPPAFRRQICISLCTFGT